jgi:hypothetical protein
MSLLEKAKRFVADRVKPDFHEKRLASIAFNSASKSQWQP